MEINVENKFDGRVEVNDFNLTLHEAENLAFEYEADGYDDVVIQEI